MTVDLSISRVRAITDRVGKLRCDARMVRGGGSIVTAEGASAARPGRFMPTERRLAWFSPRDD